MPARGSQGNIKQQRRHAPERAVVCREFPQRGNAQGQGGMGVVHVSFFARAGIVNARQSS